MPAPVIMPAESTQETTQAIQDVLRERVAYYASHALADAIYTALYAELSKPPEPETKEVEVWRVEYPVYGGAGWEPRVDMCWDKASAESCAIRIRQISSRPDCITVTGPHKQRVPA